ncbi:hypothetical protein [Mycobacteroides abscessus]|uniref:hypothetical protein n=1 Tax=Mycobacteroides abscessus TaxID=36809 RepID=UPI000C256865|nr:hypothetical protein [Mycobacteroides abscessus]
MNESEILTVAIQKAINGGWTVYELYGAWQAAEDALAQRNGVFVEGIIFNQRFAKALWGDELALIEIESLQQTEHILGGKQTVSIKKYQWHLMQMVIADDPIKYLGDHL